jgi:hypothetical protein
MFTTFSKRSLLNYNFNNYCLQITLDYIRKLDKELNKKKLDGIITYDKYYNKLMYENNNSVMLYNFYNCCNPTDPNNLKIIFIFLSITTITTMTFFFNKNLYKNYFENKYVSLY